MEVFMHNLPDHLTDGSLKKQLEPFLKDLGIVDFLCDKPKRKNFGNITFLHREEGDRFIKVHGQEELSPPTGARGRMRLKSKLQLMGVDVFCTRSKRPVQEFALRSLKHTAEQRTQNSIERDEKEQTISFEVRSFSCGYCEFVKDQLAYIPEVQFEDTGIIKFKKRSILIKLKTKRLIRIPLHTVIGLVWSRNGDLTLTLSTVPYFFSQQDFLNEMITTFVSNLILKAQPHRGAIQPSRLRMCSLDERHGAVVGQCLVYQFKTSPMSLLEAIHDLKEWEMTIVHYDLTDGAKNSAAHREALATQMSLLKSQLSSYTRDASLPFSILFQLQALAYNGYLLPHIVGGLAKEICKTYRSDKRTGKRQISVPAVRSLFEIIPWPFPHEDPFKFEVGSLMAAIRRNEIDIRLGALQGQGVLGPIQNLALIYKVMVTPSRITLHGPEPEPLNRILRRFPNHHDYFIRVQFCDEEGSDLHFNSSVAYDQVFSRFKDILTNGVQIAGRTYSFLGWSHSSLRSHSVWASAASIEFSSPFFDDQGDLQTYFSIIKALGDFSKITSPARCAARIGQAFSETPFAIPLEENAITVEEVPDLTSKDGKRVFSDGVGSLSPNVLEMIWLNVPAKKGRPTGFQIRLGGAKGMIGIDTRLTGSIVRIRPSMIKFPGEMRDLEICDMASKPIPLVLNRQMIKILEDMGVAGDWFFRLQNQELAYIRSITASARDTAIFIKRQAIGDCIGLFRLFHQCHRWKINYEKVPFLRSLVEAVVLHELRLLKHKARIPVDKGITLFGIIDETGYLQENEVYVTFNITEGRSVTPPTAEQILVTRSPALHDGDIQMCLNIIPPEGHPLRRHKNCIVFSCKGDRDLPSQLSGGDLDGDIYNIIWDPEARPKRTFSPADYPRIEPVNIGRLVTGHDMADFFINFMKTDYLGVIAIRHMIMADQLDQGTSHPDCRKLAQLHSTAVDFSKTGIPVQMEHLPRGNNFRPDFLAPGPQAYLHNKSAIHMDQYVARAEYDEDDDIEPPRKYYRSEKILGKLYRAIDERKIWFDDIQHKTITDELFWDSFFDLCIKRCGMFGPVSWRRYMDEAWHIRLAYEDAIYSARNNYSDHPIKPLSELEVFIGFVMTRSGVQTKRQRDQSRKLADEFERIATWITAQMRRRPKESSLNGNNSDTLDRCLACLVVGRLREKDTHRRRDEYGELESFVIMAACALLSELDMVERDMKGMFPAF